MLYMVLYHMIYCFVYHVNIMLVVLGDIELFYSAPPPHANEALDSYSILCMVFCVF